MLDGSARLTEAQEQEAWKKEVPTIESAFPCGTVFNIVKAKRDEVSFTDTQGTKHVLGKTDDNPNPVQSFFTTSLDPDGHKVKEGDKEVTVYNNILLFSALSKSFKIGVKNEERTEQIRKDVQDALRASLNSGTIEADVFAEKMQHASKHIEYDKKFYRNFFTQMFWDVLVDWKAERHPEISGYATNEGRTYEAQRNRMISFIGTNNLVSLREIKPGEFTDQLDRDAHYEGFSVLDFYDAVSTGRLLTCFARECDWKKWQEDHKA